MRTGRPSMRTRRPGSVRGSDVGFRHEDSDASGRTEDYRAEEGSQCQAIRKPEVVAAELKKRIQRRFMDAMRRQHEEAEERKKQEEKAKKVKRKPEEVAEGLKKRAKNQPRKVEVAEEPKKMEGSVPTYIELLRQAEAG